MLTSINNKPKSLNFKARYIADTKNIIRNFETEINYTNYPLNMTNIF